MRIWNISSKRVGGIRFIRIGRINISWSISKEAKEHAQPVVRSACSADFDYALKLIHDDVDYSSNYPGCFDNSRMHSRDVVKSSE